MKKNYMSPVVELNAFDVVDVVMTSGPEPTTPSASQGNTQAIDDFKTAAASTAGAIVVEW